ncbi:unnamed protein product [Brassica oleracea var. botrytis]|uniref:(rape) hypothetical protein n=1 Tax=Brassica napus TaxID=3708 RepID=A0A816RRP9_BRANA|nr:unnamed protein product [Brassica napus]
MASVLLLFLVFVFDLTAFGLAVAAEQRRTTVVEVINESGDSSYCVYEKDIATAEVCLLAGFVRNAYHTKYHVYFGNTAPLLLYYVCLTRAKDYYEVPRYPSIRMSSL